jgi:digeranylgeranylglycerophospholipid reductase
MVYDVAVVGAGPAGLVAAKTAAEKGLKVVVIEKRKDVSSITRACCQLFILDENYQGETVKVEQGKVVFSNNGFTVDYNGPTLDVFDKYYISPKGHKIHFAYEERRPIVVKFDKGLLLKGIWEQCEEKGVEFKSGTVAYDAHDTGKEITLSLTGGGTHTSVRARKAIIADGVNSIVSDALGMNKERNFLITTRCMSYLLEGVKGYDGTSVKSHMGLAYQSRTPVILYPSLAGENKARLFIAGNKNQSPNEVFHNVRTGGNLAPMLEHATIIKKTGCALKVFSSMKVPHRGNALAIGDAAAYVEVETQGGLMCGYRAGRAVARELSGENGFEEYTRWWQESFEFNGDEALRVAQGYALVPTYTDDELDYLFGLIEDEVLEGTYSQYKSPRLMWEGFLKHRERIARERPELDEKIKHNAQLTLGDVL